MPGGVVRYNVRRTADFIRKNGVTVRWERAIKCPCLTDDGKPSIACMLCYGHGYAYPGDPILLRGLLSGMQSRDPITQAGPLQTGDMAFTPPAGVRMDDGDRLTMLQFERRESEVVERGVGDRDVLRHLEPVRIVDAFERREVNGDQVLHRFNPSVYRLDGRAVAWTLVDGDGNAVDAPEALGKYTVQYHYRPKYQVYRLQDPRYRGAQDATMPQSVGVKFMPPISAGRST